MFLGNCENFVIDVVDEILILFENVIEIYGDIRGASNSFQLEAYEQGKRTEVQKTSMCNWQYSVARSVHH